MRVTAIRTQTERNRLDGPVLRAEKRGYWAGRTWLYGPLNPRSGAPTTAVEAGNTKLLIRRKNQATLTSSGKRQTTWGMSVIDDKSSIYYVVF